MQPVDLELYHKLKGKLEEGLDALDEGQIKRAIAAHLRRTEEMCEQQFQATVASAIETLYYLQEVVGAGSGSGSGASR